MADDFNPFNFPRNHDDNFNANLPLPPNIFGTPPTIGHPPPFQLDFAPPAAETDRERQIIEEQVLPILISVPVVSEAQGMGAPIIPMATALAKCLLQKEVILLIGAYCHSYMEAIHSSSELPEALPPTGGFWSIFRFMTALTHKFHSRLDMGDAGVVDNFYVHQSLRAFSTNMLARMADPGFPALPHPAAPPPVPPARPPPVINSVERPKLVDPRITLQRPWSSALGVTSKGSESDEMTVRQAVTFLCLWHSRCGANSILSRNPVPFCIGKVIGLYIACYGRVTTIYKGGYCGACGVAIGKKTKEEVSEHIFCLYLSHVFKITEYQITPVCEVECARRIVLDENDNLYITCAQVISKVTPAGKTNITLCTNPRGITIDSEGFLNVICDGLAGDTLNCYTLDGALISEIASTSMKSDWEDLCVAKNRTFLVTATKSKCLFRITPQNSGAAVVSEISLSQWDPVGEFWAPVVLGWPCGIILDRIGNAFFSDSSNHCVWRMDHDGNVAPFVGCYGKRGHDDSRDPRAALLDAPQALAMDKAGNIYITESSPTTGTRLRRFHHIYTNLSAKYA
ncbi:hypothetical protein Pelo_4552 [Pelomyxa schiedti]|nr:hypothetical protein Pelo_4552 [Pelomyxa schiedti]